MDAVKIGIFIQEQRKKKQLSQKQLAEHMFVSPTTVCKWEKGVHTPDISNLEQLADLFQVSVQELIEGEAAPPPVIETAPHAPEPILLFQLQLKKNWKKAVIFLAAALLLTVTAVISIHFISQPRFEIVKCFYPAPDDLGSYIDAYQSDDLFCVIVEYSGAVEDEDFAEYSSALLEEYRHYRDEIDVLAIAFFPEYTLESDLSTSNYISFFYN